MKVFKFAGNLFSLNVIKFKARKFDIYDFGNMNRARGTGLIFAQGRGIPKFPLLIEKFANNLWTRKAYSF